MNAGVRTCHQSSSCRSCFARSRLLCTAMSAHACLCAVMPRSAWPIHRQNKLRLRLTESQSSCRQRACLLHTIVGSTPLIAGGPLLVRRARRRLAGRRGSGVPVQHHGPSRASWITLKVLICCRSQATGMPFPQAAAQGAADAHRLPAQDAADASRCCFGHSLLQVGAGERGAQAVRLRRAARCQAAASRLPTRACCRC